MTQKEKMDFVVELMDSLNGFGESGEGTIALDVWRRIIDPETQKPTGQCKRERMRTLGEVYGDLYKALDVAVCEQCGHERKLKHGRKGNDWAGDTHTGGKGASSCGGEYRVLIDEYMHGPDSGNSRECKTPVPHDYRWISCYAVTGGSEGNYVHVEFMVPVEMVKVHRHEVAREQIDVLFEAYRELRDSGKCPKELSDKIDKALRTATGCFGQDVTETSLAGRETLWKPVRLCLIKTFRGMDHAAELAKRCAKLLGA